MIDKRIFDNWDHAYFLHVEGFHETRLSTDEIKARVEYVKELLEKAEKILERR